MSNPTAMTGGQLSVALTQVGWDADRFCAMTGTDRRRLMRWIHDHDNIPLWVVVLMTAMTVEEAKTKAERAQQFVLKAWHDQRGGDR